MLNPVRPMLFVILMLASIAVTYAADEKPPGDKETWTLAQCIRTAWEHHGDVRAASQGLEAARAQRRSAGSSLFYPTLSAQGTRSQGQVEAVQSGTSVRRIGVTSDQQQLLSLGVNVWDGGTQRETVRRARAEERAADATLLRSRQTLALNVTREYIRLLQARHTLEVAARQLEQARAQKTMVEAKAQAGAAAPIDVYPIEVQIASARVSQIKAAGDVRVAGSALRNAMGLESGATPQVAELPEALPNAPSLEECERLAKEQRPELAQAQASTDRERANMALARLQTLPRVLAGGRWDRGFWDSSILSQWSLNAAFVWNFWDRSGRENVKAAQATVRATEEQRDQLRRNVAAEVEQAHLVLASARERVDAARVSVTMATKNLEVAETKYKLGLAIPIEIVDAQVAFSNAQLQEIQARYDYFLARAQLDYAVGQDTQ